MTDRLVLFDIDGTLLLTGGAGFRAMARASEELYGAALPWDRVEFAGGLDSILLTEAARLAGRELSAEDHAAFRERYAALLPAELERSAELMQVMPGAHRAVEELSRRADVIVGVLTGNYEPTARAKLEAGGFRWKSFVVGAFGDEATSRPELVGVAMARFERLCSRSIRPEKVVVIGDTPRDVHCATSNGCRALGVATGKHSVADLEAAGADRAVGDLSDLEPLYELLAS